MSESLTIRLEDGRTVSRRANSLSLAADKEREGATLHLRDGEFTLAMSGGSLSSLAPSKVRKMLGMDWTGVLAHFNAVGEVGLRTFAAKIDQQRLHRKAQAEAMIDETPEGLLSPIAQKAAVDRAVAEAVLAERVRIMSIITSDEAEGREAQAQKIAFTTDLEAVQAINLLAVSPKVMTRREHQEALDRNLISAFDRAMSMTRNPEVGVGPLESDMDNAAILKSIKASHAAAFGKKK